MGHQKMLAHKDASNRTSVQRHVDGSGRRRWRSAVFVSHFNQG